jgi:cobalamin synthase
VKKEYVDKTLRFLASAMSEENGARSSRRLILVGVFFSAISMAAGFLIKQPAMAKDLMEFLVVNAVSVYFGTKMAEVIKGPPGPPAAPAA